jgi:UDP-N-acetylmuramate dehydrogenase
MSATARSEHDMARLSAAKAVLAAIAPVREHEPLARHTTFGIGGPADLFMTAHSARQLADAFVTARRHDLPVFVLGSGSNILVGDRGIRGLVIESRARAVTGPTPLPDGRACVVAESGVPFAALARRLCRAGYAGLEWAVGIPGTLGGAVVYNAGAYGGDLANVLVSARVVDVTGRERELSAAELGLEYRGSAFTRGLLRDQVVLTVTLAVTPGDRDALLHRVAELDARRLATQPRGRNAGSIFKNPPQAAAWWLIDQVGLRGHRIGDAEISVKHANFFCNAGQATAADMKRLIELAEQRVRERFGIELEREVHLVGEF